MNVVFCDMRENEKFRLKPDVIYWELLLKAISWYSYSQFNMVSEEATQQVDFLGYYKRIFFSCFSI